MSHPRAELLALLADVKDNPSDLTPWLVLCDWLEENGNEAERARSEYCRLCVDRLQPKVTASDWEKGERRRELMRQYREVWLRPELLNLRPQMRQGLVHLQGSLGELVRQYQAARESAPDRWAWVGGLELFAPADSARAWPHAGPLFALAREVRLPWYNFDAASIKEISTSAASTHIYRMEISSRWDCLNHLGELSRSPYLLPRLHLCVRLNGFQTPTPDQQHTAKAIRETLAARFAQVVFRE